MKKKSLFVISPYHYCHSTATLIDGLNKTDVIKVFSNTNHNYCKYPVYSLQAQTQVAKMADYVLLAHSALEEKYKGVIKPLVDKIKEEIILDGEVVNLSTSEFEALLLFVDNNNQVLDREFLVENLRGIRWQTYDRSVDVLVSRLRNKLGETPTKTRFLKTIHGVGYKFVAKLKK